MAEVWLLTGASAVGKSTVAQLLAERYERSVHLRGDVFRRMIVGARAEPVGDPEFAGQLLLRYRLTADAARSYAAAGFTVVAQDVVIGPVLTQALTFFDRPLRLVVLTARPEVLAARETARPKTGYGAVTVERLHSLVEHETPRLGLWLDTSDLTATEVVDSILDRSGEAVIAP